ncbi:MAG: DUF3656 domain-containing protein [Bacilli bacterium]
MKKKELLSPVGSMEALYQAVTNGCDAVYFSGHNFGARKFAPNFSNEEIEEALKYCHLYGVKAYVTVNTLILDEEVTELLDYIKFLYKSGVDALIMADLGMIALIKETFPNLEIHASTQLHNYHTESLDLLKSLGVKRAVLAREMTITEIEALKTDIELEVFIHGALCICYSGQCLFSSMILNRSGNRGECAGCCRLPYQLLEDGKSLTEPKYLLSPKELNLNQDITRLLELDNVTSLKIEGRMKSPEYVGFITRLYRNIIDAYELGQTYELTKETIKNLEVLYNRGFTKGHLLASKNEDLMNIDSSNHQGIILGEVIEVTETRIRVLLKEELNQGDGIRFSNNDGMIANYIYNKKDDLVASASKGEVIELDNKVNLKELGFILKTSDFKLLKELKNMPRRVVKITGEVVAIPGEKLSLTVHDGVNTLTKIGNLVEPAVKSPTTVERIKEQILKTGDTPFDFTTVEVTSDNAFIPIKELNELRRLALEELKTIRSNPLVKVVEMPFKKKELVINKETGLSILVRTEEQLQVALLYKIKRIYITDYKLYLNYKDQAGIYYRTSRVINNYDKFNNNSLLLGEIGGILPTKENNKDLVTDYFCNVYNAYTVGLLHELGVGGVTLSVELSPSNIIDLATNYKKLYNEDLGSEVIIYGTVELMIMKHCPISMLKETNTSCRLCKDNKTYTLKDRNNTEYLILRDCPNIHIFNSKQLDLRESIDSLKNIGINTFRIEVLNESKEEVAELIKSCQSILNNK